MKPEPPYGSTRRRLQWHAIFSFSRVELSKGHVPDLAYYAAQLAIMIFDNGVASLQGSVVRYFESFSDQL